MEENLPRLVKKGKKRVGRGYGSGRGGHTVGKGQKGQKTRKKINLIFEGVKVKKSYIKKLPLRRGKGKFKAQEKPVVIKLGSLDVLPSGSIVNIDLLKKFGIVHKNRAQKYGVKIIGNGEVKKKLKITVPVSKSVAKKVEEAGGKIIVKD